MADDDYTPFGRVTDNISEINGTAPAEYSLSGTPIKTYSRSGQPVDTVSPFGHVHKADGSDSKTDCFVLTAACGDEEHPIVRTFRALRDEVLALHPTGRKFADWYYTNGPKLAAFIKDKAALKATIRWVLTPVACAIRIIRRMPSP